MTTQTRDRSLFALLALASVASAAFSVWAVAHLAADQWAVLQPEIYSALLQFLWRGVLA